METIAEIESWIESLLDALQELIASGEKIPDELLGEIANAIEEEQSRISELRQIESNEPIPPEEVPPFIENQAPLSENVQLLWNLAVGNPETFVTYLSEFPDPSLRNLLINGDLLADTIERLQESNPIVRGQEDGIPQAPLQSSNVYGFQFNPNTNKLRVRFNSGSVYEYFNIPDIIFKLFSSGNASAKTDGQNQWGRWWRGKNPSLGAALNHYIKQGGYNYRRLS